MDGPSAPCPWGSRACAAAPTAALGTDVPPPPETEDGAFDRTEPPAQAGRGAGRGKEGRTHSCCSDISYKRYSLAQPWLAGGDSRTRDRGREGQRVPLHGDRGDRELPTHGTTATAAITTVTISARTRRPVWSAVCWKYLG